MNYGYSTEMKSKGVEFDIFIPSLSLAFEYNGEYHYKFVPIHHVKINLQTVQQRDKQKELICRNSGITLVVIPYWWDQTIESIIHTPVLAMWKFYYFSSS